MTAGQGRHYDPVGELHITDLDRGEEFSCFWDGTHDPVVGDSRGVDGTLALVVM
jgi:hypothetical protein